MKHWKTHSLLPCSLLLGLWLALPTWADEPVDFARQILPIFEAHCVHCHGADEQEGQLRLDARAILLRGGTSGAAIKPGEPDHSLLYRRLLGGDDQERMPLDDEPLSDAQLELIRRWIQQGAPWPEGVGSQATSLSPHWAYLAPQRPTLPEVRDRQWPQNPLDYFVLSALEQRQWQPSPETDKARLLRRVYLDLIGLPPAVEEVDAFLQDDSPDAYERVVDRLLKSTHYGERWARPWLDLARYADSNGYQADQFRSVWPYRDWVIQAFNADMPFDRFTLEQLAGDLLPDATLDQKIATGFHRLTTCNVEAGVDPEENRVEQIIDRVNTTGTVWLGTTLECAQCHNHKYDPFSQRDYYRMFSFFNNTPMEVEGDGVTYNFVGPTMPLQLPTDEQRRREQLQARLEELRARLAERETAVKSEQSAWETAQLAALEQSPQWQVLNVDGFQSGGGSEHTMVDDGSILVGGPKPDKDVYTVTTSSVADQPITAFRLEALTDPSLPGQAPGRHDAARPNFVLNDFSILLQDSASGQQESVALATATADFSQQNWDVSGAIDDDLKSGWGINPQFGKPHYAVFVPSSPVRSTTGQKLVFTLTHDYGGGRSIGRLRLSVATGGVPGQEVDANLVKILKTPAAKRTDKQRQTLSDRFLAGYPEIQKLQQNVAAIQKQLGGIEPPTTLVMVEMDESRENAVFRRGNFLDKGEPVQPGTPRALHAMPEDLPRNRIGLAQWLVHRSNPLVARVTVNRWWAEIFGEGLVRSEEDFGTQGDPPTHPELLDWLAVEFMDSGWSMKHVHKRIVMSATYRQSSRVTEQMLAADPYNHYFTRGTRVRMSAETIRDNALAASGLLVSKMGGPPIYPPQPENIWRHVGRNAPKYDTSTGEDRFRRGIYVVWRRSAPYPSFVNFDAPDRAACVVQRARSNTPLQALTLMNDPAYQEMAFALAERMMLDHPDSSALDKLTYGFRRCLSRTPDDRELKLLADVFEQERARLASDAKAAAAVVGKRQLPPQADAGEFAAWVFVANILLNLDETITKG